MKKITTLILLAFTNLCFAQFVPFVTGQTLTAAQLNTAFNSVTASSTAATFTGTNALSGISASGIYNYGTLSFTGNNTIENFSSTTNGYIQNILQNKSSGTSASANYVVSNNLGTANTYFGSLGINSSTFTGTGSFNLPNASYVKAVSGDLSIGTTTLNGIHIVANGSTVDSLTVSNLGIVSLPTTPAFNDYSTKVANTSMVQGAIALSKSTIPLNLGSTGGGTYSFAGKGTGAILVYNTSGGAITSILTYAAAGSGYAVGDMINLQGTTGNGDAIVRVMTLSGTGIASVQILYGGTGYLGVGGGTGSTQVLIVPFFTLTLTGTLTSNALFLVPVGSYTTTSSEEATNNNTTGAYTVQLMMATNTTTPIGVGVYIPQGTNNSCTQLTQQDGVNDVWAIAAPPLTCASSIGARIVNTGTNVSLTSTNPANITSIQLAPGSWSITANLYFTPAASTTSTVTYAGISATSATLPAIPSYTVMPIALAANTPIGYDAPNIYVTTASTPTYYCIAQATFATSTMTATCAITAIRTN